MTTRKGVSIRTDLEGKARVYADIQQLGDAAEKLGQRWARAAEKASQDAIRAREKERQAYENLAELAAQTQTPIQQRANAAAGTGYTGPSARDSAAAFEELARSEAELEVRKRALLSAIDPLWAAQERFNAEMREAKILLDAGKISTEQYALAESKATQALNTANAVRGTATASIGQMRAGSQQLSFQIGDVATQFASGTPPMTIFAQQMGQTVQAVQLMTGTTKGLIGFLAGPWGAVITGAAIVVGSLATKLFETEKAAKAAELGSSGLSSAQSVLGEIFDTTSGKIKNQNELLRLNARLTAINLRAEAIAERAQSRTTFAGVGTPSTIGRLQGALAGADAGLSGIIAGGFTGDGSAQRNAANLRNIVANVRADRLSIETALRLSESQSFDGLNVTREDFQKALRNIVSSTAKEETAKLIDQSLNEGTLAREFRSSGGGSRARTKDLDDEGKKVAEVDEKWKDFLDTIKDNTGSEDALLGAFRRAQPSADFFDTGDYDRFVDSVNAQIAYRDEVAIQSINEEAARRDEALYRTADLYETLFRGGTSDLWREFEREGIRAISIVLARLTMGDSLSGALGGLSGQGGGGIFGSLFSSLGAIFGGGRSASSLLLRGNGVGAAQALEAARLPGSATGTQYFAGGLSLVGENGPEIAALPRGSRVFPAAETRRMLGSGGAPTVNIPISIDATGADAAGLARVERELAQLRAEIPGRAIEAFEEARSRSMIR